MDDDSNPSGAPLGPHKLFEDFPEVLRRARLGVQEALLDHQCAGNTVAVWQDDMVKEIEAGSIQVSQRDAGCLKQLHTGDRVRVSKKGGWRQSFLGTVVYGPKAKRILRIGVDWYYGVKFDTPQYDTSPDSPYFMAEILSQYLQLAEDE